MNSIDNTLNYETQGLEGLLNSLKDSIKEIKRTIYTTLDYTLNILKGCFLISANYLSYSIGGLAGPITGGAMVLGRIFLNFNT